MKQKVIGWRLELVRNCRHWRGGAYSGVRAELFLLLLKAVYGKQPIRVSIYTDEVTLTRFYMRWIDEAGIDTSRLAGVIEFHVVKSPDVVGSESAGLSEDEYLRRWEDAASEAVDANLEGIESLYHDQPPDWIYVHQQTQDDCIVAVWVECEGFPY